MKRINRAQLRGRPLEKDCNVAYTTTHEYGKDDNRVFCYGFIDKRNDEYLDKCKQCKAFVRNAEPPDKANTSTEGVEKWN